jgi:spore germination protein KB
MMIEKGRVSAAQMGMMMFLMVISTGILIIPSIMTQIAKRDMWLSPIWASISGFVTVYVSCKLHNLYPKKSMIEYSEDILGKVFGKMLGFIFLFVLWHIDAQIVREYGEFIVSAFLPRTPLLVIIGCLIFVSTLAIRGGVEVLGRCSQFFFPLIGFLFILIVILLIPKYKLLHMFPIFEDGLMPSLSGSMVPHGFFSGYIFISFLLPFLVDQTKAMKAGMMSVFVGMLTMVASNFIILFVFGETAGNLNFPVYSATRYISIAHFIEHVEVILLVIWVIGGFIQISMWSYTLVIGLAQWTNITAYKILTFPVGLLLVLASIWIAPDVSKLVRYFQTTLPFYNIHLQILVPIFLLCMGFIQQKKYLKKGVR